MTIAMVLLNFKIHSDSFYSITLLFLTFKKKRAFANPSAKALSLLFTYKLQHSYLILKYIFSILLLLLHISSTQNYALSDTLRSPYTKLVLLSTRLLIAPKPIANSKPPMKHKPTFIIVDPRLLQQNKQLIA